MLTHLSVYQSGSCWQYILPRCHSLLVIATDVPLPLTANLAARLVAVATPHLGYLASDPYTSLPSCLVALKPPDQSWNGQDSLWQDSLCPNLRAIISHERGMLHVTLPNEWWRLWPAMVDVYLSRGLLFAALRGARVVSLRSSPLEVLHGMRQRGCIDRAGLTRRAVEHFVAVADRVIADQADRARVAITTEP